MSKDYTPKFRKPEDVCFWCQRKIDRDILEQENEGADRYYAYCRRCQEQMAVEEDEVIVKGAVDFPVLIDQPYLNARFPTGGWLKAKKTGAEDIIRTFIPEFTMPADAEEVYVSPSVLDAMRGRK